MVMATTMAMAMAVPRVSPDKVTRRKSSRRSLREWGIRAALAAGVLVTGGWATVQALAMVLAPTNPSLAHRIAPGNGRITSFTAFALSGPEATSSDRRMSDMLARQALRQDATAVAAASTLGLNAQVRGDVGAARRLFAYSETLSRRDSRTQLWAIEDSVGRGDISGALRHYDIALRTEPKLADLLFPVLAAANSDPTIQPHLVRTIARGAPWGIDFANYLASNNSDPKATASLFSRLAASRFTIPETARSGAIYGLISKGDADAAWAYYTATVSHADRRRSRDPDFAGRPNPTPLDWVTVDSGGASAVIQDGLVDFTAPPSVGGPLLRQTELLPPGNYSLAGHSKGIDQSPSTGPYWSLACAGGSEIGRIDIPNSSVNGGKFAGELTVPADCPIQTLLLVARPSSSVSGLSGQIDHVEIVPAR